jgi:hypothetical protein
MLEERDEGFTLTGEIVEQPQEKEEGPTSIDVTDRQISIGEVQAIVPQEERLQEQVQVQQEPKISKRKQKRRTTSYLSNISKQIEKNGNQVNKITMMVQLIQKQKQIKSTKGGAEVSQLPLQLIKQVQVQISQLQKQVTRIQNDIQRTRIKPAIVTSTKTKSRNRAFSTANIKPRSKKSKSLKNTRIRRRSR